LEKTFQLRWTKTAIKEFELLNGDKLKDKAIEILNILEDNPFQNPPPYVKLRGELDGLYSRRLDVRHRIVYEVVQSDDPGYKGIVVIVRMRSHYRGMMSLMF
jgi:Txe/YoeB family toxin of toxin-antitoxin system